jgi:hypothetical protein
MKPRFILPTLLLAVALASAPTPAAAQYTATAQAPLAGDVALGVLPPAVAGGFSWTHGSGMAVDVGQTFRAPADFSLHGATVRVRVETGVAVRSVSFQVLELGAGGDPATGVPVAVTAAALPAALAPGVTLYLTLRLPAATPLVAGRRYAFQLHFEGGGNVNDARAELLHGGDVYADGTAYRDAGGFVSALPGDLLFLVHGAPAAAPCVENGLTLCLQDGRFRLSAAFSADGVLYRGAVAEPLTSDTGWFWFFDPANVELVTKVLDACVVNGHHWAFTAGLTDVEVHLRVVDTDPEPPLVRDYVNPLRREFPPILDTAAFETCP